MKKSLIAGAASMAIAAMPVFSVFATNPAAVVDTLEINVDESCTFTRQGGSATITQTMTANQLKADFGSNTFKAECNNGKGYTISAAFTDIAHTSGDGAAITYSATTPTAGSGTWTATVGNSETNIAAEDGVVASPSTNDPAAGTTYTVNYKVSLHNNQAQGSYSGTATYTLAQKS